MGIVFSLYHDGGKALPHLGFAAIEPLRLRRAGLPTLPGASIPAKAQATVPLWREQAFTQVREGIIPLGHRVALISPPISGDLPWWADGKRYT